jgi:peptidoglycan/xylan/chitin deacetylase (PgdA/CDA1 family)
MKDLLKATLCGAYKYSGMLYAQEGLRRFTASPFIPVLLFHRITDAVPEDGITVGTGRFRRICRMLRRNFHVVPLSEVFRQCKAHERPRRRTLAITFDDCYRDNLFAARTLQEFGLPACFFVPTAFVGTDAVFPWDEGLTRMPNLTWDEVREMAAMGFEIGSHTATHADMAKVPLEEARRQLAESRKTLEHQLGRPARWFAYPFGGREHFSLDRLPLVHEAGYEGCLSAYGGFVFPQVDQPILPREAVPYFRSVLNLELHLTGCLDWLYALKRRAGFQR